MTKRPEWFRHRLIALAALGVAGTVAELAMLRHWSTPLAALPLVVLIGAGVGVARLATHPAPKVIRVARLAGWTLVAAGIVGVGVHVWSNLKAAPLDGVLGATWAERSMISRLWLASTGAVGPAAPLAAGSLAPTGLVMVLAAAAHEATATEHLIADPDGVRPR